MIGLHNSELACEIIMTKCGATSVRGKVSIVLLFRHGNNCESLFFPQFTYTDIVTCMHACMHMQVHMSIALNIKLMAD